jgi:enoyl-CoA hydratase/carnithine racemase
LGRNCTNPLLNKQSKQNFQSARIDTTQTETENPMSRTKMIPHVSFDEYREIFKQHFIMERRNGVLLVQMHTEGGEVLWSLELHRAIWQLFRIIGADPENEVMIFSATGNKWVAAFDDESFARVEADPTANSYDYGIFDGRHMLISLINDIEIPTIGALNGPGAHSELALMCDLTICSDNTVIIDPHFALHLVPGDGIHSALIELLGIKRAAYAMLMNQQIDAKKALEYGLVNEVVPRDQLLDRAWAIADSIMQKPRVVRRMTGQILRRTWKQRIVDDLDSGFAQEMYAYMCSGEKHVDDKIEQMVEKDGIESMRDRRKQ